MKFQTWLYVHGDKELIRLTAPPMTAGECNQFRRELRRGGFYDTIPLFWPVDQPVPKFMQRHLVEYDDSKRRLDVEVPLLFGIA